MRSNKIIFLWLIISCTLPASMSAQFQSFADSYGILSTIAGKGSMDVSGLSRGIYFYCLITGKTEITNKLVIAK